MECPGTAAFRDRSRHRMTRTTRCYLTASSLAILLFPGRAPGLVPQLDAWTVGSTTFVGAAGNLLVVAVTSAGDVRSTDSLAFDAGRIAGVVPLSGWPAAAIALRGGPGKEKLLLLDLRDSLRPVPVAGSEIPGAFHALASSGPWLFAARADRPDVEILFEDSLQLTLLTHWAPAPSDGPVQALVARGNRVYALCWNSVLVTLEVFRTTSGGVRVRERARLTLPRGTNYADALEAGSRLLSWLDDTTLVAADIVRPRPPRLDGTGMLHLINAPANGLPGWAGAWQSAKANVARVVPAGGQLLLTRDDGVVQPMLLTRAESGLLQLSPDRSNSAGRIGIPLATAGCFVLFWTQNGMVTQRSPRARLPGACTWVR